MKLTRLLRAELASLTAYRAHSIPPNAIRLDANESAWPLSEAACNSIAELTRAISFHRYPDARCERLRSALARRVGADPDELVFGVGSDELIAMLVTTLARPPAGRERACVLLPDPSFSMYGLTARAHGLDAIAVPLRESDFDLDQDSFVRAIDEHTPSVVFLPSPNNPTGNVFSRVAIEAIVDAARGRCVVVLDEAYALFGTEKLGEFFAKNEHVVMLGTLSKIGFAALRLGWARAHSWLAVELEKVRLPYNIPTSTQEIATLALTELAPEIDRAVALIRSERDRVTSRLRDVLGAAAVRASDANFVLVDVAPHGGDVIAQRLRDDGNVWVRSFERSPRLKHHVRITVGTPAENDTMLDALVRATAATP